MYEFPKYKQIMPADGWVIVEYRDEPDDLGRHFETIPLAMWVLFENEDGTTGIGGLEAEDIGDGFETWDSERFVCYARRDDVKAFPEEYNERAQAKRAAVQQRRKALLKARTVA